MDKKFTEGFMHDMGDLLQFCVENKTDNIDLEFVINGNKLKINITFSVNDVN